MCANSLTRCLTCMRIWPSGGGFDDDDFAHILLNAMPTTYESLANSLMTAADMEDEELDPNRVIRMMSNEWDFEKSGRRR